MPFRSLITREKVVGKQRNWRWIFPQNVTCFFMCNPLKIGQNFQTEVLVEKSTFSDNAAYQLNSLNWKINGPERKI